MSTKTTFKRVALVAVAAMGFGLLSVAPSSAAHNFQADSLTLSATTSSVAVSSAVSISVTQAFTAGELGSNETMTVTASFVSIPAGVSVTELPSFTFSSGSNTYGQVNSGSSSFNVGAQTANLFTSGTYSAKLSPSVVGTYVVKFTSTVFGSTTDLISGTAQTWTVTVTAPVDAVEPTAITGLTTVATADAAAP